MVQPMPSSKSPSLGLAHPIGLWLDGRIGTEPYAWAVVSGPSDESLWLLSRTAQIDAEIRAEIESHLEARGIDTSRWLDTEQPTEFEE